MSRRRITPDETTSTQTNAPASVDSTRAPGSYRYVFMSSPRSGRRPSDGSAPSSRHGLQDGSENVPRYTEEDDEQTQVASRSKRQPQTLEGPASQRGGSYAPGYVLAGKYRLVQRLGEGGMGTVWQATNLALNMDLAVKLLRREMLTLESGERLLTEAQAAARLSHPNVVRMFDAGVTDRGDPFLVMELLKGVSLAQRLHEVGRFAPLEAVRLLLPLASALSAAHDAFVIHRDLKPANVLLVPNEMGLEVPKLIDFGVARLSRGARTPRLTELGMVVGSPNYLAPEQARGDLDVDERADVWGLCVLCYELIEGTTPFTKKANISVLASILEQSPEPPSALGANHPLWSILRRGLEKNRQNRWRTMRVLGRALARWALDSGASEDVMGMSIATHWMRRPSAP